MSNLLSQWLKRKDVDNDPDNNSKIMKNDTMTKITAPTSASSSSLNTAVTSVSSGSATTTFNLDITNFLKESNISITDHDRAVLIKSSNIRYIDFVYPFSIHSKKGKEEKRYLSKSYFEKYKWLTYFKVMSGLFF